MAATGNNGAASDSGITQVKLPFEPVADDETEFTRADLVFTGVDHSDMSYEVRVFLNNEDADMTTPRSPEAGYAGKFVVFGHGKCFGEAGHCEISNVVSSRVNPRQQHPVTPQTKILTITGALQRVLSKPGQRLETITLVPISKSPTRSECAPTSTLFKYSGVSLQTYR